MVLNLYTSMHTSGIRPEELVDGPEDFSVLYDALNSEGLSDTAIRAEKVSGEHIETQDIIDYLQQYQDLGILDEDYLPEPWTNDMRTTMDEHMEILGGRERTGKVYSVLGSDWGVETLEAVYHGDYSDLLDNRNPEQLESMNDSLERFLSYGLVTEHLHEDGSTYALTSDGMKIGKTLS